MWPFNKDEDEDEGEEVWDPEQQRYVKKKKKTTLRDANVQKVIKASKKSKADTIKAIFDEK